MLRNDRGKMYFLNLRQFCEKTGVFALGAPAKVFQDEDQHPVHRLSVLTDPKSWWLRQYPKKFVADDQNLICFGRHYRVVFVLIRESQQPEQSNLGHDRKLVKD